MSRVKSLRVIDTQKKYDYSKFQRINGKHDLQRDCPEMVVKYKARKRHGGKIAYFNFELAKEMGLIPDEHPEIVSPELERTLLDTFSIIIINEYDIIHKTKFPEEDLLPNEFMATRYLQLQHPNKQGKTSGDGRSVWNGQFSGGGKTWDISSCGTGATKLSPATNIKNKYFKSGDPSISYGCGYSELDEGMATLFFSEVLSKNHFATERVLCLIEYPKGISINVRAHPNLIRPSHMFRYVRQGEWEGLKNLVDYYIKREMKNGGWAYPIPHNIKKQGIGKEQYLQFLDKICRTFAKTTANFEDEYIFCWLDWDGDNVLIDGGIIDYGSVRQFGLFHAEYRYDDDDRYSTSIVEQKSKAKYTIQVFAQIVDFLITGKKKNVKRFEKHKIMKVFEKYFWEQKNLNLLHKVGLKPEYHESFLAKHKKLVDDFRKDFTYFERAKSKAGIYEVPDGINCNAIYCMRDILRELPQLYLVRGEGKIRKDEFIEIIASTYATADDLKPNRYRDRKITSFQKHYSKIIETVAKENEMAVPELLLEVTARSSVINKYDRITGDSISTIVDSVLSARPKLRPAEIHSLLRNLVEHQDLDPEKDPYEGKISGRNGKIVKRMLGIIREFREGV